MNMQTFVHLLIESEEDHEKQDIMLQHIESYKAYFFRHPKELKLTAKILSMKLNHAKKIRSLTEEIDELKRENEFLVDENRRLKDRIFTLLDILGEED